MHNPGPIFAFENPVGHRRIIHRENKAITSVTHFQVSDPKELLSVEVGKFYEIGPGRKLIEANCHNFVALPKKERRKKINIYRVRNVSCRDFSKFSDKLMNTEILCMAIQTIGLTDTSVPLVIDYGAGLLSSYVKRLCDQSVSARMNGTTEANHFSSDNQHLSIPEKVLLSDAPFETMWVQKVLPQVHLETLAKLLHFDHHNKEMGNYEMEEGNQYLLVKCLLNKFEQLIISYPKSSEGLEKVKFFSDRTLQTNGQLVVIVKSANDARQLAHNLSTDPNFILVQLRHLFLQEYQTPKHVRPVKAELTDFVVSAIKVSS